MLYFKDSVVHCGIYQPQKTNIMNYEELLTQTENQLTQLTHDQLLEQSQQLLNCLLEQTTRNRENELRTLTNHYHQILTTPRRLLGE